MMEINDVIGEILWNKEVCTYVLLYKYRNIDNLETMGDFLIEF